MTTQQILDQYEPTIGIECHVQLKTKTKLFSGADNDARDAAPNTKVSPICFGLPGTLPVLNAEAVDLAIRAGIALNAEIAEVSSFDRKHYFYPDLPKGYQITQLERPTIGRGKIMVPLISGETFAVRITRAHMEEDAGKLTHPAGAPYSLVDFNRAGTPLIEIVSEADIHSAEQAKAYVQELYLLMVYADVTYGDLHHGNMRFDVNISVAKKGAEQLGTRAEIKNLNTFRAVEKVVEYEFKRQVELLERGEKIVQETRGWKDDKSITVSQRSKEDAMDYRYFPETDLPPLYITPADIALIQQDMPTLPPEIRQQLAVLELDSSVVQALLRTREHAQVVCDLIATSQVAAKRASNWFASVAVEEADQSSHAVRRHTLTAEQLLELSDMVEGNDVSSTAAKEIFAELVAKGGAPRAVAEAKNLLQVSETTAIEQIVDTVLADPAAAKAIADIKAGNDKAIGFLVGQAMKLSKGAANPAMIQTIIKQRLSQ